MASNILRFFVLTALSLLLLAGFASAASLSSAITSQPSSVLHNSSSFTVSFNLNNSGVDASPLAWSSSVTSGTATITVPTDTTLGAGENKTFSATVSFPAHQSGTLAWTITANPSGTGSDEVISFSVPINSSSTLDITQVQDFSKSHNASVNVNNTGNTALTVSLSSSGDFNVSFGANVFSLAAGSAQTVNVNAIGDISEIGLGLGKVTITAAATGANDSVEISVQPDFCEKGNINETKIKISDLEDTSSENEWEWKPLDVVRVRFEIENDIGDDEDFTVSIALYDTEDDDFVDIESTDDSEDGDSLEKDVSIDEDDSETVDFEFEVPSDLEESDGRYILYVKAFVEGDEDKYCNSYAAKNVPSSSVDDIKIEQDSRDVIVNELTTSSDNVVQPGDTIVVTAKVYNIGSEDEDKVKVSLVNTKLGLDLESTPSGLDSGESDEVQFSFIIPQNAENGVYSLRATAYFDYKKSSDDYRKDSDIFEAKITVVGGSSSTTSTTIKSSGAAAISASLDSEAEAGEEMSVSVTITNTLSNKTSFVVGVSDYEKWASLESISDRILTLNPGESKTIDVKFNVNDDAAGEQTFTLETAAGSKIDSKQISVKIEESSLFSKLSSSLAGNTMIWVIGAINVVLLVLIIVLAVKFFRR